MRAITWQRLLYSCLFRGRCLVTDLHDTILVVLYTGLCFSESYLPEWQKVVFEPLIAIRLVYKFRNMVTDGFS
jgi:hypothetical protein